MPKYENSILSEEKVHFFYYDVMRNLEDNLISTICGMPLLIYESCPKVNT